MDPLLAQLLDYLDIVRHYAGHYGSLAILWYWEQPADLQVRLYAAWLCLGMVTGAALHRRLRGKGK